MLGHHVTLATDVADATLPDDPIQLEQIVRSRQISLYLPFLVGMWLDAVFLGLILIAFCRWVIYVRPSDSRWTQALVWWLMLPTAVTSAFLVAHNYFLFVTGFADYLRIFNVTFPRATTVNFVASRIPAAAYFAIRAWRLLNKPIWLPITIIPCFLVCLVGGIAHTVLADRIPLSKISLDLIVIYSAFEVASDVIITGSLFYGLLKRKTGWMHTDRLITRLTRLMMETQTPPAVSALVFLTMSLVVGDGTLLGYFIFYGKVHVLCLLYVVNSRIGLSEGAGGATTYSTQSNGQIKTGIRVQTETIIQGQSILPDATPAAPNDTDQDGMPDSTSTTELVRRQYPTTV